MEDNKTVTFNKIQTRELLEPTLHPSLFLKSTTLEKAKEITIKAQTGWSLYTIKEEFIDYNKDKENIKNIDGLFIGFVKKKVAKCLGSYSK